MANGYLGKISAVVSASTGDFDSKLAKSAKEVANFASRVQGNLTSASSQAARALEGIYTPLQKVERSLRAAESMKLSFKGFKGLIGDVDALQRRLQGLNERQIDIVLKTSGMKSITEFRDAINGLTSKDVEIITRVGGLEKISELREQIRSSPAVMKVAADVESAKERIQTLKQEIKSAADSGGKVTVPVDDAAVQKLEGRLAKATAALKRLQDQAAAGGGGSRELDAINEQLDALNSKRESLEAKAIRVRGDERELQKVRAVIDGISEKIDSLEKKQARVAKVSVSTDEFKAQIAEAQDRVDRLTAALEKAKASGSVVDIKAKYDELTEAESTLGKLNRQLGKKVTAEFGVNVDIQTLDDVAKKAEAAGAVLGKLPRVMEELGRSDLTAATTKMRQMVSQSEELSKPIAAATQQFGTLTREVQAGFLPALSSVQNDLESLARLIDDGVAPAKAIEATFVGIKQDVDQVVASVSRLAEASAKVGKIKTGRELFFDQPGLSESLDRGAAIGDKAAALPASAIQANPRIVESLVEVSRLSQEATVRYAKLQAVIADSLPTGPAQLSLDLVIKKLGEAQEVAEKEIRVTIDTAEAQRKADEITAKITSMRERAAFVITGRPQNMEQADGRRGQLEGDIVGLDRAQRQNYKPLLEDAAMARLLGDLDKYNDVLDQIAFKLAQDKKFNLTTADAKKKTDDLKASIDALKESAAFQFTGLPQNRAQAEGELRSTIARAGSLDPAALARVTTAKDAAIAGLGNADFGAPLIKVFVDLVDKELQAKKAADDLKAAMAAIGDDANPSQPIDILKKNLAEAKAAVAKLDGPMKAIGEKNIAKIETFVGANAGNEAAARLAGQRAAQLRDAAVAAAPPPKPPVDVLGADFGTAARGYANLQANVVSLQNSLEKLPMPLQAQFIPAINKVRDAFKGLGPSSTAAEIDAVTKKAAGLERVLTRAQQATKLGGTLGDALNTAAFTRTEKQIGFIRAKLLDIGAAASGPVADAFNKYAAFVESAARKGTLGLAATKEQADQLAEKIGEAALAAGLFKSKAEAASFVKGIGDVGRAGADKFALALNQAAFAVDDFLSSTGGLEFKLRAISNNVTQLAFILGGTQGLWIGLGAVIAGQAAVALIKYANNGRSAEDQTKALNDALARQKSLVEELAQAFRSLGDSMSRGTFSTGGERAAEFSKQLEDIRKKQNEAIRNSVADFDPEVIKERAEQQKLKNKIEKSTDVGEIAGLQRQLEESRRREREAADRAVSATPPDFEQIQKRLRESLEAQAVAAARDAGAVNPDDPFAPARAAAPLMERAAAVPLAGSVSEARQQVDARIQELSTQIEGGLLTSNEATAAKKEIAELTLILGTLSAPLLREINKAATEIAAASRGPAEQIRQAQEEVAEAIRLGLPGARLFQQELDNNAEQLAKAYKRLESAASGKDENGRPLTPAEAEGLVSAARADIDALNARRRDMAAQTDAFANERIVDPQRQIDARLGRARSNLSSAGLDDGRIARRMREIEAEREQIRRRAELPEFQTPEMRRGLQDAEQALNEEAAAIEAATIAVKIFAAELNKAAEEVAGNLNSAQQRADEARRADLGNSTPATREARRQAEADLEAQRGVERRAQEEIEVERDRLEEMQRPQKERVQEIDEELKSGRAKQEEERKRLADERAAVAADVSNQSSAASADVELARKRNEAAQAQSQTLSDLQNTATDLGIDTAGMGETAVRNAIRDAGRGDLADEFERRNDEGDAAMVAAGFTKEERGAKFWDAVRKAGEELAAALARQAEVANEGAARLAEIDAQIAAVPTNDSERREELIRERETLVNQMEDDARRSQKKVDAARDASTAEEEFQKSAARGRELGMTERDRDREKADGIGADIAARASQIESGRDRQQFIEDATRNAFKDAAPILFSMDEQFKNAMREPSRARLQAADINTSQGQSELNRLLRGDDDAKNQNLEALNKQISKLEEIRQAVVANTGQVVN